MNRLSEWVFRISTAATVLCLVTFWVMAFTDWPDCWWLVPVFAFVLLLHLMSGIYLSRSYL